MLPLEAEITEPQVKVTLDFEEATADAAAPLPDGPRSYRDFLAKSSICHFELSGDGCKVMVGREINATFRAQFNARQFARFVDELIEIRDQMKKD